jgi:hypothetical protein
MKHKMAYIEWVDSQIGGIGWQKVKNYDTALPVMKSVGFVINKTKTKIALASSIGVDANNRIEQGCNIIIIPLCSIKKIKYFISSSC